MAITSRVLLLLIPATLACSGEPASKTPAPGDAAPATTKGRPSLVIATLDTTRADRIGAYGYSRAYTPHLDAIAAAGARFDRAYAVVPLTTPAHASMFTGVYPPRHGIHTNGDAFLHDDATTLAEVLEGKGYRTGASVSAFVTTQVWNLDQGFQVYYDTIKPGNDIRNRWQQERPADEVVEDALTWLDTVKPDEPFFLWVHFYDPHAPYRPPGRWASELEGRPYDGEIAFVDEQIGRLQKAIELRQQKDGVAWIAVADHGEALRDEHGEVSHGTFLYNETTHIPFLVQPPTPLTEGRAVATPTVSNVDVMPTALGLLGLTAPPDLDGVDLSPLVRGEPLARPGVYMEAYTVTQRFGYAPELAAAEGPLKLMDTPNPRLFDVVADPGEVNNLAKDRAADVARLKEVVAAVQARAVNQEGASNLSPEVIEQLAALGYVGAGSSLTPTDATVDAKDKLDTLHSLEKARSLGREEATVEQAIAIYQKILATEPQISEARMGLGQLYERNGRAKEAEKVYRDALAVEPGSTVLHQNLAANLARQGRPAEALVEVDAVLALVPRDESARTLKMRLLGSMARDREALDLARGWLAEDPDDASMQAAAGMAYARLGDNASARPLLEAALADPMPRQMVAESLAQMAATAEDYATAAELFKTELDYFPQNPRARRALGMMYMRLERWDEAEAEYRFLAENFPEDWDLRRSWAQAVFNTGDYKLSQEVLAPALKARPEDPMILLLQANILAKIGDRSEAEKVYQKAKALAQKRRTAPGDPGAMGAPPPGSMMAPPTRRPKGYGNQGL